MWLWGFKVLLHNIVFLKLNFMNFDLVFTYNQHKRFNGAIYDSVPSQHTGKGHRRPTSETPLKWRLAGGPIVA